jgi:hypothetical protein
MKPFASTLARLIGLLPRVALMSILLAAPVLAVPLADTGSEALLEAPVQKKSGMGLVILVSLQRA